MRDLLQGFEDVGTSSSTVELHMVLQVGDSDFSVGKFLSKLGTFQSLKLQVLVCHTTSDFSLVH